VIPRNRTGQHRRVTDRAIVDVVRDLARVQPDQHIARVLNRLGYRTGAGNTWTEPRVLSLRRYHQIPAFDRSVDRQDTLTIAGAAAALGISATTVRRLIVLRLLPATQPVLCAPWTIRREDLERDGIRRAVGVVKAGCTLPRTPDGSAGLREINDIARWALVMVLNWVNSTGEYMLGSNVAAAGAQEIAAGHLRAEEHGAFIGHFYAGYFQAINVVGMVLQLFVVSRVIAYLGLPAAVCLMPLVALACYG
jgi:hypothetical protein